MNADKVAIITGGSRGIGAATAKVLAEVGYNLCINFLSNERAALEVVQQAKSVGVRAIHVQGDIAQEEDVLRLFEVCDREMGRLTALVNNAGIVAPQSRVDAMSVDRIERVFSTNVTGAFVCCREAVKRLSTQHGGSGGSIVNVSSAAARIGSPSEYVDYAASKAALDILTRGLSLEVASEGVRVNAVRPGIIDTEIHASGGQPDRLERFAPLVPMQCGGTATEVAHAIRWLLSDEASYTTGAFIEVSGGR